MKLSLKTCGPAREPSSPFRIVLVVNDDPEDTVVAELSERVTGPAFGQTAGVVEDLVRDLVAKINARLAPPPVVEPEPETKVSTLPKRPSTSPKGAA